LFILLSFFILCLVLSWFLFLGPLFPVSSFLLWNSLWLVEEVLALLCFFLNCENGDFSIL
jgi:hypothetical protein